MKIPIGHRHIFSVDDETILRKVSNGIRLGTDGHYKIPLSFNDDEIKLPNNKGLAAYRPKQFKSRFANYEGHKEDYVAFMNQMIMKGTQNESYQVKKPSRRISLKKNRVDFDCSCHCNG